MTDHDAIAARVRHSRDTGGPYAWQPDLSAAYLDLYDKVTRLLAALDDIAAAAFWIANEIHIGPEDEGRDLYDMALAIRDDARAAMKGDSDE